MRRKTYISLLVACATVLSSCEKRAIDNFMVDDTVALLTPGLVEATAYTDIDSPYEVYVLKSGKGRQSASVSIAVDESVMTAYNATAKLPLDILPADCYTITCSSLDLAAADYEKPFLIKWNYERLEAVLETNKNVGLPLRMSVIDNGININENRLTTIIKPSINKSMVSFTKYGIVDAMMPTRQSLTEEDVYMTVETNFIPDEDIDFTFEIDAAAIEAYNEEHGTDYKMLPSDAFRLDLDGWSIKKSQKTARFKFTFVRTALIPEGGSSLFGNYMLPIRLKSLSSSNIDPDKDLVLYPVEVIAAQINKDKWSIYSCNSDIRTVNNWEKVEGDYVPEYLIDGSTKTIWRSIWSDPTPLPIDVVIDLGMSRDVYKMTISAPTGAQRRYYNSKSGIVEIASSPEGPWTRIADWNYPSKTTSSYTFELDRATGQYIHFVIDESFDGTSKMAISELSIWGE